MSPSKTNWKSLLVIAALLGTVVVCCVGPQVLWIYPWRDTTPRGELAEPTDWPEPIRDLHGAMLEADIDPSSFGVYLLYGEPGSTLSRVVCCMDASDEAREFLVARLELQPIAEAEMVESVRQMASHAPADWWPSEPTQDVVWWGSARLLVGDEADVYVVADDKVNGRLFVHYDFNF